MSRISKPIPFTIGGRERLHYFDANAYSKFEEISKEFFLNFFFSIERSKTEADDEAEQLKEQGKSEKQIEQARSLHITSKISLSQVMIMLWATRIVYVADRPTWPDSLDFVRRNLGFQEFLPAFAFICSGISANNAKPREDGEGGEDAPHPTKPGTEPEPETGGTGSGPSQEDVLALMTPKRVDSPSEL